MAARTVTGEALLPTGQPWPGFVLAFDVLAGIPTPAGTYPPTTMGAATTPNTVTVTTDDDGAWSVELATDVPIRVTLLGSVITARPSLSSYPDGVQFTVVVPSGDTPISLETVRAAQHPSPQDPTLPDMVAQVAADLLAHKQDTANPHGVTAAQAGTYSASQLDTKLAAKADAGTLGTAAATDATDYATAAQGALADTAVQPATLASHDTANRDRANHTGTQTADTISDFASAADARITRLAGQPDGLATLGPTGLIPTVQLPPLALTSVTVVADEAAMLALDAQAGDLAIREDTGRTNVHNGGTAGTVADWSEITAAGAVTSVNGYTGTVTLAKGDVGLGSVDNTADDAKPVSTAVASALAGKVGLTGDETVSGTKTFAASPLVPAPSGAADAASKGYADGLAAGALGVVLHGDDPDVARPAGYGAVMWIGSVEPSGMLDGDPYIDTGA